MIWLKLKYLLDKENMLDKKPIAHCCILTFDPVKNAIQGDAPEGSDTF